mmetsp:Transcript_4152/g.6125  ORF Transcript_4152/g.6125 Transcript_4152/m.6125 type:complete len:223 (+) Transcript_4152:487-1155(+)
MTLGEDSLSPLSNSLKKSRVVSSIHGASLSSQVGPHISAKIVSFADVLLFRVVTSFVEVSASSSTFRGDKICGLLVKSLRLRVQISSDLYSVLSNSRQTSVELVQESSSTFCFSSSSVLESRWESTSSAFVLEVSISAEGSFNNSFRFTLTPFTSRQPDSLGKRRALRFSLTCLCRNIFTFESIISVLSVSTSVSSVALLCSLHFTVSADESILVSDVSKLS